jgi:hypothetical protein
MRDRRAVGELDFAIDVSGVQPEAREIVRAAAAVYARHTAPWLIGLIVHGSAYKGGFIPGCSDIDLKLFLRDDAFAGPGARLPFELAASIQRDLARIDPAPFQYIQGYAEVAASRAGRAGPIPGAYHVVLGQLPVPEATEEELRTSARAALDGLDPYPDYIVGGLLQHGGGRLERAVRFVCTDVWPMLYQSLALQQESAVRVWGLPKRAAIELLTMGTPLRATIERFYASVVAYYGGDPSVERAVAVLQDGVAFLTAAHMWRQELRDYR